MTDLIALAKQAGLFDDDQEPLHEYLQAFAEAIRQEEREACAKLLENGSFLHDQSPYALLAKEAAKAIRARTTT